MSLNLDKSKWSRVAFGEVVQNVNETVRGAAAAGIERIVAMEHLDPGELKVSRWGTTQDGTTFTRLVKPTQTLFGKRRAYQRKVAYAEFEAICSGDILTFEAVDGRMLPEFLPFLVQSGGFFDHALGTSAGSLSPRTNWRDLSKYAFDLPPLDQQRRIADILWAVERHKTALAAQLSSVDGCLKEHLRESFSAHTGKLSSIADLCVTIIGGVWGNPPGEEELDVQALGPRVYADGATLVTTDHAQPRSLGRKQAEERLVQMDDIVLERSGGSPTQPVGRVVIAPSGLAPTIPTDFQRLLRVNSEKVHPKYLYWRLRYDWMIGLTRSYSKKTTNITNLSVRDYLARCISVPSPEAQAALISEVTAFETVSHLINTELKSLSEFATTVLMACFGDGR